MVRLAFPMRSPTKRPAIGLATCSLGIALVAGCSLLAPSDAELLGRSRPGDAGSGGAGTDAASSGGAPSTGGRTSTGGRASGGAATGGAQDLDGSAGATPESGPPSVAPKLGQLRLNLHCGERTSGTSDSCFLKLPSPLTACPAEGHRPEVRATMQGDPGVTYAVTLHVRGVVEPKTYRNGQPVPGTGSLDNKGLFYAGGEPGGNPIYNSYGLDVTAPSQRYFVNNWVEGDYVLALDYRVALQIESGATVSVYGFTQRCQISYDCEDLRNVVDCPYKPLAGVEHLPDHGQFLQVDFESATAVAAARNAEAP